MATSRTSQTHEKRVRQIASEAADKIAADSPLEEEVIVSVEEVPPGESPRTRRGQSTDALDDIAATTVGAVGQAQGIMAESINRWVALWTVPFGAADGEGDTFGVFLDPRRLTEESFRVAEAVLTSQKEYALRVMDLLTFAPAKAA